jgi:PadR family transcriptional regulator, regulatory protein PadR
MPKLHWAPGGAAQLPGMACPRRINRFLEPCLLLLLRSDASHGYDLTSALVQFGFGPGMLDSSVVYRTLRDMEEQGLVTSEWDTSGSGPPRRVYQVTLDGEEYLHWWISDLRQTLGEIKAFLEAYDQQKPYGQAPGLPADKPLHA